MFQAGAVPVRPGRAGSVDVLLITRSGGSGWGIPKGTLRTGEPGADAAAREVLEEAGAAGSIIGPALGEYRYTKGGVACSVQTFVMVVERVERDWAEARRRRRAWVTLPEALRLVEPRELRALMKLAGQHLSVHFALVGAK